MVAKITSPNSIKRALNYNEKKVQKGIASCIYAGNFLADASRLNFYDKLQRFQDLISLNTRAQKSNTLHISLNFHPSENLNQNDLQEIAKKYIEKIGFEIQPYLVYEHQDAAHQHIHIVTTNIQSDGKRIDTFNIGRLKSEAARREIEKEFNLIRADDKNREKTQVARRKIPEYGKSETKQAITNVLNDVLKHYNFNSLASLNAILKTSNMIAHQGKQGGRIHKHHGLLYQMLDNENKKVGVPIKASAIYNRPTLDFLKKLFEKNKIERQNMSKHIKMTIDTVLRTNPKTHDEFFKMLKELQIDTVIGQNETGFTYGITFVDHKNKCVFNGSEIGKKYSFAALQNHFSLINDLQVSSGQNSMDYESQRVIGRSKSFDMSEQLKNLLRPEYDDTRLLNPLLIKKKRKKRKPNV